MMRLALAASLLTGCAAKHSAPTSAADTRRIVCMENTVAAPTTAANERIFAQTFTWLDGWLSAVATAHGDCAAAQVLTDTRDGEAGTECVTDEAFLRVFEHVRVMLDHPEQTRQCFDPTNSALTSAHFRGYALSADHADALAKLGITRPDVAEQYPDDTPMHRHVRDIGRRWAASLAHVRMPERFAKNIGPSALPDVWQAAGWVPFYADPAKPASDEFRGGYLYAELLGPWGMIRVDTVDGDTFHGEIGPAWQAAGTFYPPHHHHPPELYVGLTANACPGQQQIAVVPRGDFADGAFIPAEHFVDADADAAWAHYESRRAVHSFRISDCDGTAVDTAMISAWARSSVRDGTSQSTHLCEVTDARNTPHERAAYSCGE